MVIAVLGALVALAAADAGHEDEDGYKSDWLVAEPDCPGNPATPDSPLTLPARLVVPASAHWSSDWMHLRDCGSR